MKKLFYIIVLTIAVAGTPPLSAQTFSDFVNRVNNAPTGERSAIVDSFMAAVPSFPHIEFDTLVHFIYRGNTSRVDVPGDFNGWNPSAFAMAPLGGTNFWYATAVYEDDARLDYKFVLGGNNWILDPRNPYTVSGGFGPNSELRMPAYVPPPEIEFYSTIDHGSVVDSLFQSSNLGNSRRIRVYLPPGYDSSSDSYPMILFNDGLEYISLAFANRVIDYLISENRIEPVIAVFVPPVNRTAEYAGALRGAFSQFIVDEVVPWIAADYRVRNGTGHYAVMGASNGGNISLWLALSHPEVFGNVAAQSSNIQGDISAGFQNGPLLDLDIYMDLGTYDIPVLIPLVRNFIPILQNRGYNFLYNEYHEGHSWGSWRAHIDDALIFFFPSGASGTGDRPVVAATGLLRQNYPNPFNPGTTIEYQLHKRSIVDLRIFNLTGQPVITLLNDSVAAGLHRANWNGRGDTGLEQPSGVYFYQLRIDGRRVDTRKMLLLK